MNVTDISPPLTNQHAITLFSQFAVKKAEHHTNWSEQINQLTLTLFSLVQGEKSDAMLIGRAENANCCHGII